MILVLNCMMHKQHAASFAAAILRPVKKSGKEAEFIPVTGPEPLPDPALYSHVILSGSEASTLDDMPWDAPLQEVIARCVSLKKPLLAICYGHQFLARTLAGRQHVTKAQTPEFGWTSIHLEANPLFEGLPSDFFSMVCHYDLVRSLPPHFKPIASSRLCDIHGYQYQNLPVWGVQFHPECNFNEAKEIFETVAEDEPEFPALFDDTVLPKVNFDQNERIFLNFLSM